MKNTSELLKTTDIDVEKNTNTNINTNNNESQNIKDSYFNEPLLGDRFRLLKVLGSGGMSTVYLAENINLGTYWAIKKINKNFDQGINILVEPNILKRLNHPALPRIIDIMEDDNYLYIVQDFIEGISLDKEIENVGRLPVKNVIQWSLQICDVLIYLHEFKPNPIIYRDMKPANIILTPWGEIKLVDFGIAREYKKELKNDTTYIGTKGYAAPEQYGDGQSSVATDIYCFGVTIFHMLTGELPKESYLGLKLVSHCSDNIPPILEQIICKCTRFNPEERYSSVKDLKQDIKNAESLLLGDLGVENGKDDNSKTVNRAETWHINGTRTANETEIVYEAETKKEIENEKEDMKAGLVIGNKIGKAIRNRREISRVFKARKKDKVALRYKSIVITVWDNTEFACELAYITAKATEMSILLADLDLLSPKVDLQLNIKKYPEMIIKEGILNESGINIALDYAEKGLLTRENLMSACIKRKEVSNLNILTGNYRLENYEYYNNESLSKFIDKTGQIFDIIILAVNRSIYDSFTAISLIKSDINVIPIHATIHEFREFNNYLVFLKDKQKIPLSKNKFIAYEYNPKTHLPISAINEVTQQNYLGSISFCPKREMCRNMQTLYAKKMDKKVVLGYIAILHKLGILTDGLETCSYI